MDTPHRRLTCLTALLVVLGSTAAVVPSGVDAQRAQLELDATTTDTDAPVKAMAHGEQPIQVHFEYSGLGSGTHDMELRERDPWEDEIIREFSVEGDSGSRTFHLSPEELERVLDGHTEGRAALFVRWGEEETSNTVGLTWQDTTVYTKGYGQLPDEVEAGEEVTVEYYGWTNQQENYVRLVEDDPPLNAAAGNDETVRRDAVSGPGYFEGTFTFTPSEFIAEGDEEGDGEVEVQARPSGDNTYTDLVRNISVAESEPEIDARIADFAPASGEYRPGDVVRSQVVVENTGDQRHTFFVGYGVVDEDGTVYDNDGTAGTQVSLSAGQRETVTVSWDVEEDAPPGSYDVGTAVWEESNPADLETRLDDAQVRDAFRVVEAAAETDTPAPNTVGAESDDGSFEEETSDDDAGVQPAETATATEDGTVQDDGEAAANARNDGELEPDDVEREGDDTGADGTGFTPVSTIVVLLGTAVLFGRRRL